MHHFSQYLRITPFLNPSRKHPSMFTGERPPAGESTHLRFSCLLGRELTALHYEVQKLPSEHSLHKLWMLAREPHTTLFETHPVERDKSRPSTETNLPLDCMVLRGGIGFGNFSQIFVSLVS